MKHILSAIAAAIAATILAGCGTVNTVKDKVHEWTAPDVISAPDATTKGAGGGGRR